MAVATERRVDPAAERRVEPGVSLARGPALILGTILLAAGLYFLYRAHTFPKFSSFPNGHAPVEYKAFGIFGINGWTGMLTAVAGGLLLFGAAQHHLAKAMSLIVGVALGAAAIIALISGNVLGMAAANHWTELGWGIAAVILLFNTLIPRRRRVIEPAYGDGAYADDTGSRRLGRRRAVEGAAVGAGAGAVAEHEHDVHRQRAAEREAAAEPGGPGRNVAADQTRGGDPAADQTAVQNRDPATGQTGVQNAGPRTGQTGVQNAGPGTGQTAVQNPGPAAGGAGTAADEPAMQPREADTERRV